MKDDLIKRLERKLKEPLPGIEAQYRMANAFRPMHIHAPPEARLAGVLALFFPKNSEWHVTLIERVAHNPNDRHRGQISFPGGKYEEGDGALLMTALRETHEEIGVDPASVHVLGQLTELYIPVSNFLVNPFVGYVEHPPHFFPDPQEVQSVLEVPFSLLEAPETVHRKDFRIGGTVTLKDVPYFLVFGKVVWGATAMMLNELLEICRE